MFWCARSTLSASVGERIPRNDSSRVEPLNPCAHVGLPLLLDRGEGRGEESIVFRRRFPEDLFPALCPGTLSIPFRGPSCILQPASLPEPIWSYLELSGV